MAEEKRFVADKRNPATASKEESHGEKHIRLGLRVRWSAVSCLISVSVFGTFVLLFAFLIITSFLQKSPTVDEPMHLFAGYSYLKWGDFRANPEHPPLAKVLAALPLLAFDINDPRPGSADWDLILKYGPGHGPGIIYTNNLAARMLFIDNDADRFFFYARLPMIALGILLGIFVYLWSKELFGTGAAVVSLFLYGLDPNILAHSQLVHTDLPFTAFCFISTYFFWRTLGRLTWPNLLFTCFFFGLAAITKHASFAVFIVWAAVALSRILSSQPQECTIGASRVVSSRWEKTALVTDVFLGVLLTGYLFVWSAYGLRFHAVPGGAESLPLARVMPQNSLLQGLVYFIVHYQLFPEAWIYGQLHVFKYLDRTAYLFGQLSDHGFWLYFPVAFLVKTPLPTLLLLVEAIYMAVLRRRERAKGLFLLIPVLVYFSLALGSRMNIGLRHILPIYPFLFVFIGGTAAELRKESAGIREKILICLGVWYVWSSVSIYPHYLAYFNELVGRAKNGHKVLVDSNLDWGQDLKGLKRWMGDNQVKQIQLLYFGFRSVAYPQYYKINALAVPGSSVGGYFPSGEGQQLSNYLAVSVHRLYGPLPEGAAEGFIKAFRAVEPIATIGYSIHVYRIDSAIEYYRRAVQSNPTAAETHANLAYLLYNQGKSVEAIEHFRLAVQSSPAFAEAHRDLGVALVRQGEMENAIPHLLKALELSPPDHRSGPHYYLGLALAEQGRDYEAIQHFEDALKIRPDSLEVLHALGRIIAAEGQLDRAVGYFQKALDIDPESADVHESLGRAYTQLGKREEAVRHYEKALQILKSRQPSRTPSG
jgi:tetratricopeptide (TPR) repeat protein